jgi:hypothetical protein
LIKSIREMPKTRIQSRQLFNSIKMKSIKYLVTGLLLVFAISGRAQCSNTNGDIEAYTSPSPGNQTWINDDLINWYTSHGSPSASANTDIWMWSYNKFGIDRGEGIYTNFNFVNGVTYTLTYDLWRDADSNPTSEFRTELTNTLTPNYVAVNTIVPTPASQPLPSQPWTGGGIGSWVTITEVFTPTSNYTQLWLYPYLDGAPVPDQAACRVDNICITPLIGSPCDFEPNYDVSSHANMCSWVYTDVSWPLLPYGVSLLEVKWDFGDGTTGTGTSVVHNFDYTGTYTVCMEVWTTNGTDCCMKEYCQTFTIGEVCDPCAAMDDGVISFTTDGETHFFEETGVSEDYDFRYGYFWDFKDGSFGIGKNVSHIFDGPIGDPVALTIFYYNPVTGECCQRLVDGPAMAPGDAPIPDSIEGNERDFEHISPHVNDGGLSVYPNPNNGKFELKIKGDISIKTVNVYDQTGKSVFSETYTNGQNRYEIDLSEFDKGMYIVIVNEADEINRQVNKLVIQ